jgi:hypothetical protein
VTPIATNAFSTDNTVRDIEFVMALVPLVSIDIRYFDATNLKFSSFLCYFFYFFQGCPFLSFPDTGGKCLFPISFF